MTNENWINVTKLNVFLKQLLKSLEVSKRITHTKLIYISLSMTLLKQISVSHDFFTTSKAISLMPLQIGLAVASDNRLASKWLNTIFSALGFSVSYDEVFQINYAVFFLLVFIQFQFQINSLYLYLANYTFIESYFLWWDYKPMWVDRQKRP